MRDYKIKSPDGRLLTIRGPADATPEQLSAAATAAFGSSQTKPVARDTMLDQDLSPTAGMSGTDKFLAGTGKAFADLGRGVGQLFGAVSNEDVAASRKEDEALMKTGAGMAGNVFGNLAMLAPTALIPGANTVTGAGAIGAITGFLQPSTSRSEVVTNTLLGGAGGAAGQSVANKLPGIVGNWAQGSRQQAAQDTTASAQKFAAAQRANQLGYVVPPADLNPGVLSEVVSGLSGKIKTAQVASAKNQTVTDGLVKQALGVPQDAPLTVDTLNAIRQRAGQSYDAVANVGVVVPDETYAKALDAAVRPFTSAANSFPGRRVPQLVQDIQALKTSQFDAGDAVNTIRVLRNDADLAYRAGSKLEGKAYKDAAEALESAIDNHLVATSAPADILANYRNARQTIAKTYTVQKALNTETGNVSANKLASELSKGKPLTGEMLDVAKTATAFPKATQSLKEAPKQVSPLDIAVALGLAGGTASPYMLASIGARPLARNALLSNFAQKRMLNPGFQQSLTSRVADPLLNNQMVKLFGGAAGTVGGLSQAEQKQ